jgi:hypothetical protein
MIVDLRLSANQLNQRRNLSGVYFFTLCFYTYCFFASYFYAHKLFNLLKSAGSAAQLRRAARRGHMRGTVMTGTMVWRRAAPA